MELVGVDLEETAIVGGDALDVDPDVLGDPLGREDALDELDERRRMTIGRAHARVVEQARDDDVRVADLVVDDADRVLDVRVLVRREVALQHVASRS